MKKKNCLIICNNIALFDRILLKNEYKNIIILSNDILFLEKIMYYNINIYPLVYKNYDIISLFLFLKSNFLEINEIIINFSDYLNSDDLSNCLINTENNNFYNFKFFFIFFNYLNLLKKKSDMHCTFFLSKKHTNKGNFFLNNNLFNNLLVNLLKEFSIKYFNIFFNLISVENLNYSYKKKFYPYRIHRFVNKEIDFVYYKLIKKKIRNKIFVI